MYSVSYMKCVNDMMHKKKKKKKKKYRDLHDKIKPCII